MSHIHFQAKIPTETETLVREKKPKSIILQHYVQLSMLFHSKMILFECFSSVVRPHLSGEPRLQPRPRSHVLRT